MAPEQSADTVARPRWRRPWLYWGSDLIVAAAILLDAGRKPKIYGICPSKRWALVVVTHGKQAERGCDWANELDKANEEMGRALAWIKHFHPEVYAEARAALINGEVNQ